MAVADVLDLQLFARKFEGSIKFPELAVPQRAFIVPAKCQLVMQLLPNVRLTPRPGTCR